jgi:hypothetical protein
MRLVVRSVFVVALTVAAALLGTPGTALADSTTVGYDVSHPQCDASLPRDSAFAVVGVNGGLSTRANPCLEEQLDWAWESSGTADGQPRVQLYLNTANPGQVIEQVTTWPVQGATPYGTCDGTNTTACSWQYGWERAQNSVVSFFIPAARAAKVDSQPSRYTWWLDVETVNTWQTGSSGALARNRATLEGMTAYLVARGAKVGVYSTGRQWAQVAGSVPRSSNLAGRHSWLAGATSQAGAQAACEDDPLLPGGRVVLSQYVRDDLDHNHSCR